MTAETVFPIAMGNEEETGMLVTGDYSGELVEPEYFSTHIEDFIPPVLHYAGRNRFFLSNGGLIYAGGAIIDSPLGDVMVTNPERATPECATPTQTSEYIDAHEKLIVEMGKIYAEKGANNRGDTIEVRIQRRTVDAAGNRKACHDSYGYRSSEEHPLPFANPRVLQSFLGLLATRSFMTGAGHVTSSGLRFSQKNHGLTGEEGYGYFGTMYRVDDTEKARGVYRVEARSNDINLSGWAKRVRIGGPALHLALGQTELAEKLPVYTGGTNHVEVAKRLNGLVIDDDGELIPEKHHFEALAFQRVVAELALDKLHLYTEVSDEYFRIAHEMYKYCDDFEAVLKKEKPFTVLANRSDAMVKFQYIARRVQRDRGLGRVRDMTDMIARMHDMQYDYIDIHARPYSPAVVNYGYGYRLRNKGHFVFGHDANAAERAYYHPPKETRAHVRAQAIRRYDMHQLPHRMEWHAMSANAAMDGNEWRTVPFGDVDSPRTSSRLHQFLAQHFEERSKQ